MQHVVVPENPLSFVLELCESEEYLCYTSAACSTTKVSHKENKIEGGEGEI